MREELISVIVPAHNGQAYLKNCIDSIAAQSYDNLEILVVNDGSTDQTAAVCEELKKRYKNVQVFTLGDVGVSAARNYAMERSQGAYITFVDADDRLCPGVLNYLYERINATKSDLAGCRFVVWSTEDDWKRITADMRPEGTTGKEAKKAVCALVEAACFDSYHYLTDCILQDNCRCWSKLYRKDLLTKVRFREGLTVGEDMLFLVDLLPFLGRAVETDYPGYGYYQNPAGVMRRPFTPAYMDQIKCWELAEKEILPMDVGLKRQTAAKITTAIMLTVGKIALCSGKERREAGVYLARCRALLGEQMRVKESGGYLPPGYSLKAKWFYCLPGMYVWCYHILQAVKNRRRNKG